MEIWKDVVGFEGFYQVSNMGRIKRLSGLVQVNGGHKDVKEYILKQSRRSDNYMSVTMSGGGKRKTRLVARIVAENFIENLEFKKEVNHISGDKSDNSVKNLEWTTRKENAEHASKNGLMSKGESHGISKLKNDDVICIRKSYALGLQSQNNLARIYGVSHHTIWCILKNITWTHI